MARLIALLLLVVLVAFVIMLISWQQAARPRSERTYRPRAHPGERGGAPGWSGGADSGGVVSRSELDGVRDAYSSAALDPSMPLYRCAGCLAYYHRASLDALAAHNHGRCALCGGSELRAVQVRQ